MFFTKKTTEKAKDVGFATSFHHIPIQQHVKALLLYHHRPRQENVKALL